jgi:hypothetical protein
MKTNVLINTIVILLCLGSSCFADSILTSRLEDERLQDRERSWQMAQREMALREKSLMVESRTKVKVAEATKQPIIIGSTLK